MNKAARRRWLILLSLLVMTLGAIFYPEEGESLAYSKPVVKSMTPPQVAASSSPDSLPADLPPIDADPFAPREWQPAPVPAPVAPKVLAVATAPEAPALPEGPPPLPFRFVGSMNDKDDQVVYLGRGEQALVARSGETLEGTYKVLGITAQQIEFEHLPTGEKQTLLFPTPNN